MPKQLKNRHAKPAETARHAKTAENICRSIERYARTAENACRSIESYLRAHMIAEGICYGLTVSRASGPPGGSN